MLALFSRNEHRIGREREFEADKASVSVSSPEDLATALGKVAIYSHLWEGVQEQNVYRLTDSSEKSLSVLDDMSSVEEALTLYEHRLMVAFGFVEPPDGDEENQVDTLLNSMYALAAAMVGADGKIVQSEVAAAEAIGSKMFSNFYNVDFRDCCNNLGDLPEFRNVVDILAAPLDSNSRSQIYNYLRKIAMADDELADEEEALLRYAREKWEIPIDIQEEASGT
jgi:uncharacterized tellurite resistance protein B-like protein